MADCRQVTTLTIDGPSPTDGPHLFRIGDTDVEVIVTFGRCAKCVHWPPGGDDDSGVRGACQHPCHPSGDVDYVGNAGQPVYTGPSFGCVLWTPQAEYVAKI